MRSIPPIEEIEHHFQSPEATVTYLVGQGNLTVPTNCTICHTVLKLVNWARGSFRCTNSNCRKRCSMFKKTIFKGSNLPLNNILKMGYYWLQDVPNSFLITTLGYSSATVSQWSKYFRQAIGDDVVRHQEENLVGGEGIFVEIDESKFGKRKYNKGHQVDGVWVVGGVERTPERRIFLVQVENRSEQTLLDTIYKYVKPGSTVYTDCWKGYTSNGLLDMGMTHGTVNHSLNFVDPSSGVHTNTIEGSWAGVKRKIAPRLRTKKTIDDHLYLFIWKRKYAASLWDRFLIALATVVYLD
eukprot:gene26941-35343_t